VYTSSSRTCTKFDVDRTASCFTEEQRRDLREKRVFPLP
jgi:hypothetical protein